MFEDSFDPNYSTCKVMMNGLQCNFPIVDPVQGHHIWRKLVEEALDGKGS